MTNRRWVVLAIVGCSLVVLAMIAVTLVLVDKETFGSMVGSAFLQTILSGVMIGGLLVLVASWRLPRTPAWGRWFMVAWGLIAVTSPIFGYLFLAPWSLLVLTLPVVSVILVGMFRATA